ncbi:endonuclease domain-containing protein [Microbispora sp. NBC_01189]|uniref:endonuclease domain-containing protein n=1 Tax=Microbispora sp. NBC_01189 TaxID=2903583 RepID=UPI003A8E29B4
MLELWHNGRCGICGKISLGNGLVRDHDHKTGLIRGLLCDACNRLEGTSTSPLFDNYRKRPPSQILEIEVLYLPSTFRAAASQQAAEATAIS